MIRRLFNECLLRPGQLNPSQNDLEVIGAFNPGAVKTAAGVTLLIRVAETPREKRTGWVPLPRWDVAASRVVTDWLGESEVTFVDARVVILKRTGWRRLTFISHLVVAHSEDGRAIDAIEPLRFLPADENEEFGVEDPRITPLDGCFYFTYVAVSRHGAATALASTTDFKTFQRHGIIFPPENKDVVLFPERIGGFYLALHRPNPAQHFSPPEMWLATSPDLIHWGGHVPFLGGAGGWEAGRVGAGTPPIRTPSGWLEIYHGNDQKPGDPGIGRYSTGTLLLDLENPRQILAAHGEIMIPETDYECAGFVPNVVFPTGIIPQDQSALVYYGAADEVTAVVELGWPDLLGEARIAADG